MRNTNGAEQKRQGGVEHRHNRLHDMRAGLHVWLAPGAVLRTNCRVVVLLDIQHQAGMEIMCWTVRDCPPTAQKVLGDSCRTLLPCLGTRPCC